MLSVRSDATLLVAFCLLMLTDGISAVTNVTIYYETHCPDSQKLFVNQVIPALDLFKSSVLFKLVPYGFADYRDNNGELSFRCQHGPKECEGNMLHGCAAKHYANLPENVVRFAACTMRHGVRVLDFVDKCATLQKFSAAMLRECAAIEGPHLLRQMGDETTAAAARLFPGRSRFKFIPSTFIDEKAYVQESVNDLQGTICRVAVDRPAQC
ncbi:GILT-like protein 1 [Varroa jacobsoni]|uniref:Uncharacterized protein n=1 Tax=Varroa destructor TaxID=109461 RepID=A0A7M7KHA4_VARDE|nr:GILT-like protein 1 [Varroa destructor]XP_022690563.1 GILT-like protein 1 [Varroa jacobsoni]